MRRMLSRLFGRERNERQFDFAKEDWAPVPAAEAVSTDWAKWLAEDPGPPPRSTPVEGAAPLVAQPRARVRTLPGERRWRDVLTAFAEHLTDEELRIIRGQMAS